jgi:hypothetical protein
LFYTRTGYKEIDMSTTDADWERVTQAIPGLAAHMLKAVIYPYEDIEMVLDDYLHFDEGDAMALGVVLTQGNRFSRISDIRGDELYDTKIAILSKVLDQLIPEIRSIIETR